MPALVEQDDARERGQPLDEVTVARLVPEDAQVSEEAADDHEVDGTVADDGVGDVDIAAERVPNCRKLVVHRETISDPAQPGKTETRWRANDRTCCKLPADNGSVGPLTPQWSLAGTPPATR